MTHDLLEQQLADADTKIPPLPADFDRSVHQRLNRTLAVGQLTEFICLALPSAFAEFARALAAAGLYTASGKYPAREKEPVAKEPGKQEQNEI